MIGVHCIVKKPSRLGRRGTLPLHYILRRTLDEPRLYTDPSCVHFSNGTVFPLKIFSLQSAARIPSVLLYSLKIIKHGSPRILRSKISMLL